MNEHSEKKSAMSRRMLITWGIAVFVVIAGIGSYAYWRVSAQTVYIDQSVISAPLIALAPANPGILRSVFVNVGDDVSIDEPIAQVGTEIVKARTGGEIVSVNKNIGQLLNPAAGDSVASMIHTQDLRVIGHLEEDKGLADVQVGERASFSVDAFGSKTYEGVVDEVSPTSRAGDVVFSISDQRPTNEFDVEVRFDPQKYPELKNGMSAKIWVFK